MVALAILGFGLVVLMRSATRSIYSAEEAHMMGVVTDLARGKMYDIEEKLLKEGFTDTDQSQENQTFAEEGWPDVRYSYKVEQVELPSFDTLTQMTVEHAKNGSGSGSGSGSALGSAIAGLGSSNPMGDSMLGGMLGMLGGGKDISSAQGGAFIQAQFQMVQETLKVSIRKVTLTVNYKALGQDQDMTVVAFFTDPAAMDKVLNGLGSQDLPEDGTGSGSGSGRGSGKGSGSGSSGGPVIRPPTGSGGK